MENITFIQFLEKVDIISNRNQSADTIREANQALSLFKKDNENLFLTESLFCHAILENSNKPFNF